MLSVRSDLVALRANGLTSDDKETDSNHLDLAAEFAALYTALWPAPWELRRTSGRPRPAHSFLALRFGERHWLLPTDPVSAAAAVRGRRSAAVTMRSVAARQLGAAAVRFGAGRLWPSSRFEAVPGPDGLTGVWPVLAEAFPEARTWAISFGPARANRKPVIEALAADGRTVGFAKVGWNALTRRLVLNEAEALQLSASQPGPLVQVPALVGVVDIGPLSVMLTEPLDLPRARRGHAEVLPRAMAKVAAMHGAPTTDALAEGAWWRSVASDAAELAEPALDDLLAAVDHHLGGVELAIGSGHGDWSEWNMGWTPTGVALWDWERSGTGVPLGLDAVHMAVQRAVGRGATRADAWQAVTRSRGWDSNVLGQPAAPEVLPVLYAVELCRRKLIDAAHPGAVAGRGAVDLAHVAAAALGGLS